MKPQRYRRKGQVLALHYLDEGHLNLVRRFLGNDQPLHLLGDGKLGITTLEGVVVASPGDWIIRGWKGEFWPCKPDVFEATYEKVINDEDEEG